MDLILWHLLYFVYTNPLLYIVLSRDCIFVSILDYIQFKCLILHALKKAFSFYSTPQTVVGNL